MVQPNQFNQYPPYGTGGQVDSGYAQPPGIYGYSAPTPNYPGTTQPVDMNAEIKWSNLDSGGALKTPLKKFIGRLDSWKKEEQFNQLYIKYSFANVQVLDTDAPWPYATADIYIKYSSKENSGWGKHVESVKALGLARMAATLEHAIGELMGKVFEVWKELESYGTDKATGNALQGEVYRFKRIVQVGAPVQPQVTPPVQQVQPQVPALPIEMPNQQMQQPTQPVAPPIMDPVQTALRAAQGIPVQQAPQVTTPPVVFDPTPLPTDTPQLRALKLLHGQNLNAFLGLALNDDVIKADPNNFIKSIYDSTFVLMCKAGGQVVEEANGTYRVVA